MEKKSLENLLNEKQESLEVSAPSRRCQMVWTCDPFLVSDAPRVTVCVLETNQWSEEWKRCFEWKAEIRGTEANIQREGELRTLCIPLLLLDFILLSCQFESINSLVDRDVIVA